MYVNIFLLVSIFGICCCIEIKVNEDINVCCNDSYSKDEALMISAKIEKEDIQLGSVLDDKLIEADIDKLQTQKPGFSLKQKGAEICLVKTGSSVDDSMDVICRVREGGIGKMKAESTHTVLIFEPVSFIDPLLSSVVIYRLGEPVNLMCAARGSPELKVLWRNSEGVIASGANSARLYFEKTTMEMLGNVYTCQASIEVESEAAKANSIVRKSVELDLQYPPQIKIEKSEIYSAVGVTEIIKLTVKSNPVVTEMYCRSESELDASVKSTSTGAGKHEYVYEMTLKDVKVTDKGNYRCVAINQLGIAKKNVSIILAPSNLQFTSNNLSKYSNYYKLRWAANSQSALTTAEITLEDLDKKAAATDEAEWRLVLPLTELVSEGEVAAPINNWRRQFVYDLINVTANNLYRMNVRVCNAAGDCLSTTNATSLLLRMQPDVGGSNRMDISALTRNSGGNEASWSRQQLPVAVLLLLSLVTMTTILP